MYIFGGYGRQFYGDLWRFDFKALTWRSIPLRYTEDTKRVLGPRQFHTTAVLNDVMYVCSGSSHGSHFFDQLWGFNLISEEWSLVSTNAPTLYGAVLVAYEDCLYIHGGRMPRSVSDRLWEFNTITGIWTIIQPRVHPPLSLLPPRHFHSGFAYKDQMIIFGGLTPENTNQIFSFTFHSFTSVSLKDAHALAGSQFVVNKIPFADVTFTVGSAVTAEDISAHRCILFWRSSYFRALFSQENHSSLFGRSIQSAEDPKSHSGSYYRFPVIEPPEFKLILEWIYSGTITIVHPERVALLASAADQFNISDLLAYCEHLLILALTSENVHSLLSLSETVVSLQSLHNACISFLQSAPPAQSPP